MTLPVLAVRPSRLRCAYCRDDLGPAVLTCVACRTLIHEECELDACPTLGCGSLAPWELVLPAGSAPTALELVGLGLLVALVAATGTVSMLLVVWPRRPPDEGVEAQWSKRLPPGPDPDVPALDPWFWWAPGSEIVVRTRIRQVHRHDYSSIGCGGPGPSIYRSWTEWSVETSESEVTLCLESTSEHEVFFRVTRVDGPDAYTRTERRPLDMPDIAEPLEEGGDTVVALPAGVFTAVRYRRSSIEAWKLPDGDILARPVDPQEETWSDPRIPVPLRRLVTWHVQGAPPEVTGSLETIIVAIRGQAAIR